ncbi:MAG: hypothetical protein IKX86_01760 [Clostridia bacterium]|nr:hypothetical protein [Clostridia bacterium]MBR5767391.1 hypothetical protein [Clostridia bacterium]
MNLSKQARNSSFFDSVIICSENFLSQYGFTRSGKSPTFYKISGNKSKGAVIHFKRSLGNTADCTTFGINYAILTSTDVLSCGGNGKVTVAFLKQFASNGGLSFDVYHIDELKMISEKPYDYFTSNVKPKLLRIVEEAIFSDLIGTPGYNRLD